MLRTRWLSRTFLALIVFSIPCCEDLGTGLTVARSEDTIREAVFRYLFVHNYSGQQQGAKVYFIGSYVPGDSIRPSYYLDPSDAFMSRFLGNPTPVKKISQCVYSMNGVVDKQTGDSGLLLWIKSIREVANDQAEVEGGYFEGGLSASGNRIVVQRIGDRWVVVKDYLLWIA